MKKFFKLQSLVIIWGVTLSLIYIGSSIKEANAEGPAKPLPLKAGLTGKAGDVKYPSLAVTTDGEVFIVYEEEIQNKSYEVVNRQVWLKRYDSHGKDVGKGILLYEAVDLGATDISVDGAGNLHMVWSEGGRCDNDRSLAGHNAHLFYRKWNKELSPVLSVIELTETCFKGSDFDSSFNDVLADMFGNVHILSEYGYVILDSKGNVVHEMQFQEYSEPIMGDMVADGEGNVYLLWASWNEDNKHSLRFQHVRVGENGKVDVSAPIFLMEKSEDWYKRTALSIVGDSVLAQAAREHCSGIGYFFLGHHFIEDAYSQGGSQSGDMDVYTIDKLGKVVTKKQMPVCGTLIDGVDGATAHFVPIFSMSCGKSSMDLYHAKALLGKPPGEFRHILSIAPHPFYDHGPAFWEEAVVLDGDENLHITWFLNNGGNNYIVHYLKLDREGNPLTPLLKVAP